MIRKFILDIETIRNYSCYLIGNSNHLNYQRFDNAAIDFNIFKAVNGEISARDLTDSLFPDKEPHIFISHSSKDKDLAVSLANTLYINHNIKSFVDSQLWGHIDTPTKMMHEMYCKNGHSDTTYSYEKSNALLSHLHNILSASLMRAMDKSDCVIFIMSESSIYKKDLLEKPNVPFDTKSGDLSTLSPWIFSEIQYANLLRSNPHKDRKGPLAKSVREAHENVMDFVTNDSMPKILHDMDMHEFRNISNHAFLKAMQLRRLDPISALDEMYIYFDRL